MRCHTQRDGRVGKDNVRVRKLPIGDPRRGDVILFYDGDNERHTEGGQTESNHRNIRTTQTCAGRGMEGGKVISGRYLQQYVHIDEFEDGSVADVCALEMGHERAVRKFNPRQG